VPRSRVHGAGRRKESLVGAEAFEKTAEEAASAAATAALTAGPAEPAVVVVIVIVVVATATAAAPAVVVALFLPGQLLQLSPVKPDTAADGTHIHHDDLAGPKVSLAFTRRRLAFRAVQSGPSIFDS
jgi:hypothetical protein